MRFIKRNIFKIISEKLALVMPKSKINNEARLLLIGQKIKDLRIDAGYTSYENFANEYDFSRRYYWGIENGQNITIKMLVKILDIHNLSLFTFFSDPRFK